MNVEIEGNLLWSSSSQKTVLKGGQPAAPLAARMMRLMSPDFHWLPAVRMRLDAVYHAVMMCASSATTVGSS